VTPYRLFAVVLAALAAAPSARADIIIQVTAALGPNVFDSPSYDAYRDNALAALQAGASQAGTPGTPAHYAALAAAQPVNLTDLVVTDFPSWCGSANPSGAFAGETGTRVYFGLAITRTLGETFRIADLSFSGTSTDPFATLDFSIPAGFYTYNADYLGITASGEVLTSGPATREVVAIYGRGASNAYEVLSSAPGATNQEKIDAVFVGQPGYAYTGTYRLGTATGSATVALASPVPAPPGLVMLAVGVALLTVRRRL